MNEKNSPAVECQMMIRKPAKNVFDAFIDPKITTRFWFTKSDGKLEKGKTVKWEWEMYGATANVLVKEIISDKKTSIEWGAPPTTVDFLFEAINSEKTMLVIRNYGFDLSGDELIEYIKANTGGFTTVVDGLKAHLEHNLQLNLVADKFPGK